ncbi:MULTISPECIES: TetR/AcrR family transcriptional regulator [Mycobacterium]|nr:MULTISPECIES: TetR/AcrR family transcriptional regulator [Mycobacterium]ASW87000.1 TetR/AcrR family transcriptional regulator [Mycobacterium intracellulare]UQB91494.1 TetR/AcrR family transcriptional regulator; helix-turn-helix transcriptional regulator [Mycobacterium intracellulare]WSE47814.1 helix-turn-helix domain-containing protein [Mycobacterium sp. 3-98]
MPNANELSVAARRRRERERNARRDSILAAAQETFSTRGFAGSTMEEVALRAEITKPTLYGYFRTKDELLLTLMLPVFADIGSQLQALQRDLEAGAIGSCPQLIGHFLDAVLTPYRSDPERFRLTQLLHQTRLVETLDPDTLAALDTQGRKDFTLARSILRTAVQLKLIRDVPVAPLADVIWGIVVGTIQVEDIKNRTGGHAQHTATLQLAADLLAAALDPATESGDPR